MYTPPYHFDFFYWWNNFIQNHLLTSKTISNSINIDILGHLGHIQPEPCRGIIVWQCMGSPGWTKIINNNINAVDQLVCLCLCYWQPQQDVGSVSTFHLKATAFLLVRLFFTATALKQWSCSKQMGRPYDIIGESSFKHNSPFAV